MQTFFPIDFPLRFSKGIEHWYTFVMVKKKIEVLLNWPCQNISDASSIFLVRKRDL